MGYKDQDLRDGQMPGADMLSCRTTWAVGRVQKAVGKKACCWVPSVCAPAHSFDTQPSEEGLT